MVYILGNMNLYLIFYNNSFHIFFFFFSSYFGYSLKVGERPPSAFAAPPSSLREGCVHHGCMTCASAQFYFSSFEFRRHRALRFSLWNWTVISSVPVWIPKGPLDSLRPIITLISGLPASIALLKTERFSISRTERYGIVRWYVDLTEGETHLLKGLNTSFKLLFKRRSVALRALSSASEATLLSLQSCSTTTWWPLIWASYLTSLCCIFLICKTA